MDNTLRYDIKELIDNLFDSGDLRFGATLTEIKETKSKKNDGEAVFAISFSNSFENKSSIFTVSINHFEEKYKKEKEENTALLLKAKDIKKITKEVINLLPKEAIKEEKELCKRHDGHTRNHLVFPTKCVAEKLLAVLTKEKEEMIDLIT